MGLVTLELILQVEDAFGIAFTDDEAIEIATIADFEQAILEKVPSRDLTAEQVHARLKEILVRSFGVREADVLPTARIVRDLGLD